MPEQDRKARDCPRRHTQILVKAQLLTEERKLRTGWTSEDLS